MDEKELAKIISDPEAIMEFALARVEECANNPDNRLPRKPEIMLLALAASITLERAGYNKRSLNAVMVLFDTAYAMWRMACDAQEIPDAFKDFFNGEN